MRNGRAREIVDDPLLTASEAAEIVRRPVGTLYNWRSRGEGPPSLKVGGKLVFRRSELERWLEDQERATLRGGTVDQPA